MQQNDSYDVLDIRRFLTSTNPKLGEKVLRDYFAEFSCPLNPEVERFLKEQAIEFAKKHQAVTYLLVSLEDIIFLLLQILIIDKGNKCGDIIYNYWD